MQAYVCLPYFNVFVQHLQNPTYLDYVMIFQTYELHEQQKFHFRQSIIQLQNELHKSQIEKDALADLR